MTTPTGFAGGRPEPGPVDLLVLRQLRRSRPRVLFRLVLVIPHAVVVYAIAVAAVPVWLLGFVAALALGRLPAWVRTYLDGVVRWATRVQCYVWLLTDDYPPFAWGEARYAVLPTMPPPTRLRRWAVLLRLPLAPVASLASALVGGIQLFVVFAWFAGVLAGRTPRAVFDAVATTSRWQYRIAAYMAMLVPTFPWGLFGDGPALPSFVPGYGTPAGFPGYGPPSPGGAAAPPGFGPPSSPGFPHPSLPEPPAEAYPPPGREETAYPTAYPPPAYPPAYPPPVSPAPRPRPSPHPGPAGDPAGYPGAPPVMPSGPGTPMEPVWYGGLLTGGGRAIVIISLALGALQLASTAVDTARGGGFLAVHYSEIGDLVRITADAEELRDQAEHPTQDCAGPADACALGELSDRIGRLDRHVRDAPERGHRRADLLVELRQLQSDVRRAGARGTVVDAAGDLDPAIGDEVDRACRDAQAYAKSLLRD